MYTVHNQIQTCRSHFGVHEIYISFFYIVINISGTTEKCLQSLGTNFSIAKRPLVDTISINMYIIYII